MLLWRVAYALTIFAGINYLWWLYGALDWSIWFLAPLFFTCEFLFMVQFLNTVMLVYSSSSKSARDESQVLARIAVIIPVCGEGEESVRVSLDSVLAISYPSADMKIFITDDRGDEKIKMLAEERGVMYHTHPRHNEAKAGNLNRVLKIIDTEWILVIDTGDVIEPDIISQVGPFFTEVGVAFIQVQRRFDDKGSGLPSDTRFFYDVIMPRRDRCNAIFACGSGAFWRVSALRALGGFSSWNIVEDYTTSYLLQTRGLHGRYVLNPLHIGTVAPNIRLLFRQRYQWACDSLRLLFWRNPLLCSTLNWTIRMAYAETALCYLFVFPMVAIRLAPVVIVFANLSLFNEGARGWTYWIYFMPLFCGRVLTDWTEFHLYKTPFFYWWKQAFMHEGLSLLYMWATVKTLVYGRSRKPPYRVTPKDAQQGFFPYTVGFQIGLFMADLVAVVYAFYTRPLDPWLLTLTIWLLYGSLLLLPFIASAAATANPWLRRCWRGVLLVAWLGGCSVLVRECIEYLK